MKTKRVMITVIQYIIGAVLLSGAILGAYFLETHWNMAQTGMIEDFVKIAAIVLVWLVLVKKMP